MNRVTTRRCRSTLDHRIADVLDQLADIGMVACETCAAEGVAIRNDDKWIGSIATPGGSQDMRSVNRNDHGFRLAIRHDDDCATYRAVRR